MWHLLKQLPGLSAPPMGCIVGEPGGLDAGQGGGVVTSGALGLFMRSWR